MNEFNTNVKYFQKFNKYNQNMLEYIINNENIMNKYIKNIL